MQLDAQDEALAIVVSVGTNPSYSYSRQSSNLS
jgi:hypothetical protein